MRNWGSVFLTKIQFLHFRKSSTETELVAAIKKAKNEKDYIKFWRYFLGLPESDFQYMCIKLLAEAKAKGDFLKLMSNPQTIKALDKITDAFGWVAARTTYCGRKIFNTAAREYLGDNPSLDKGSDLLNLYLQKSRQGNSEILFVSRAMPLSNA